MGFVFAYRKSSAQPEFTSGAAITGTAQVGQTLTCTYTVTKARAANVRVEWWRHINVGAEGTKFADGATCVLSGNEFQHVIRAIVYAANPAGTVQSVSAFTAEVTVAAPPDPPTFDVLPSISGDLETGGVLTVAYTLSGETSVSRQWYRYTSSAGTGQFALEGQTGLTYTVSEAEVGLYVGCVVTGTNSQGDVIERAIVGPITQAAGVAPIVVTGASVTLDDGAAGYYDGEYLICDAEVTGHTSTPTFAWYKCDNADGTGTPTLLTGAGLAAIQPLPYSEPNAYRGAIFLDQSLALGSGGKYVYCVMSATNSQGTTTSTSAAVGPIGTIQGTPISQTTVGSGEDPYLITSSGTYYLTENIEFKQTGFALLADDITLNLNGKTVTWNNEAIVGPTNPSFESGAANWDWTGSGNTSAGAGDSGGNEYLRIQTTIASDVETAEQRAYNNGNAHDGASALAWTATAAGDNGVYHYVESEEFTCTADKWYSISFRHHAYSRASTPIPKIELRKDGATVATWSLTATESDNLLGKGPTSGELMFKAASTSPTYTIRVGAQGVTGKTSTGWFDDFRICRGRAAGVLYGQDNTSTNSSWTKFYSGTAYNTTRERDRYNFAPPPDVASFADITGGRLKNGTLTQGAGQCFSGHAFKHGYRMNRVTSSVNGPNASHVGPRQSDRYSEVMDCLLTSTSKTCAHREAYYGAALWLIRGIIARNRIEGQPASGICCLGGNLTAYGNTIRGKVRATNCFGIMMRNSYTADVHDNVVDQTGEYYGRGVMLENGYGGDVYNNYIAIEQSQWNSDTTSGYKPYVEAGDYCLQIEGPGAASIRVYGNEIRAICAGPVLNYNPRTIAIRPKGISSVSDVQIYNNSITVTASGDGIAHAFGTLQVTGDGMLIRDNTINTNSGVLYSTYDNYTRIIGGQINYESSLVDGWPIVIPYTTARPAFDLAFRDVVFNAEAESLIPTSGPRNPNTGGVVATWISNAGEYRIEWTITVETGQAGAAVTVTDQHAAVIASGVANDAGVYVAVVPQTTSEVINNVLMNTTHSPYTASATLDALSGSTQFTADATKTVVVSMT